LEIKKAEAPHFKELPRFHKNAVGGTWTRI